MKKSNHCLKFRGILTILFVFKLIHLKFTKKMSSGAAHGRENKAIKNVYRIYSINCPGRLLNFWALRVGADSRWALIRGWVLIKFSPFSASEVCLFCNKTINANTKRQEVTKQGFCKIL